MFTVTEEERITSLSSGCLMWESQFGISSPVHTVAEHTYVAWLGYARSSERTHMKPKHETWLFAVSTELWNLRGNVWIWCLYVLITSNRWYWADQLDKLIYSLKVFLSDSFQQKVKRPPRTNWQRINMALPNVELRKITLKTFKYMWSDRWQFGAGKP